MASVAMAAFVRISFSFGLATTPIDITIFVGPGCAATGIFHVETFKHLCGYI